MMRRYEFVDRCVALIREELEKNLPEEATLDEMIDKASKLIKKVVK